MNKRLFPVVLMAGLLASGAVFAQGLPFSSDYDTSLPWGINQSARRDMNVFHAGMAQPKPNGAATNQDTARH